jgi:hypothetical protein
MEGFSVKKRAIGRPDTLRASFEQGNAGCVVQGRQFAMDYRAFQMRESSCLQVWGVEFSRI